MFGRLVDELAKAHIPGYYRKNGVYVRPHERGRQKNAGIVHPRLGENGKAVQIKEPSVATKPSTWHNPETTATFLPDGDVPSSLNGVALTVWRDHPTTLDGWEYVDGINEDLQEPDFHAHPAKHAASGVVIEEPDGRVWLVSPTNKFGGYEATFPKGTEEKGLSFQANAIKEAFEETGLKVEITGFIGDFDRTTSVARMYRARRVGGTPTAMGWESQAVHLVPKKRLYDHLNMHPDHAIAEIVGAGKKPFGQS